MFTFNLEVTGHNPVTIYNQELIFHINIPISKHKHCLSKTYFSLNLGRHRGVHDSADLKDVDASIRFIMRWTSTGCRVHSFGFTIVIS